MKSKLEKFSFSDHKSRDFAVFSLYFLLSISKLSGSFTAEKQVEEQKH